MTGPTWSLRGSLDNINFFSILNSGVGSQQPILRHFTSSPPIYSFHENKYEIILENFKPNRICLDCRSKTVDLVRPKMVKKNKKIKFYEKTA